MSYNGSNTRTGITADERNTQSIIKKLHNIIEIKDNRNENHTVDNNKIKENNKNIVIIGDSMFLYQRPKNLSKNNNFMNVRFHPSAATEDIVDFIKSIIQIKTRSCHNTFWN